MESGLERPLGLSPVSSPETHSMARQRTTPQSQPSQKLTRGNPEGDTGDTTCGTVTQGQDTCSTAHLHNGTPSALNKMTPQDPARAL